MKSATTKKRQRLSQEEIEQTFRDLGLDDPEVRRRFQQLSEIEGWSSGWKRREYYDRFAINRRNFVGRNPGDK